MCDKCIFKNLKNILNIKTYVLSIFIIDTINLCKCYDHKSFF